MSRRRPELTPEDLEQEAAIAQRKGIPLCAGCGHYHQPGMCAVCDCGHRHHIMPRHAIKRMRRARQRARERDLKHKKRSAQRFPKKRRTRSMRGK